MVTQSNPSHSKTLLKILVGAAWLDGEIQPEEQQYLQEVARGYGLAEAPDIKPLLYGLVPVSPERCYGWIRDYLGDRPSEGDFQELLHAISALIYSDSVVAVEEAKLLTRLQGIDPATHAPESNYEAFLRNIRKLYQGWLKRQG